VFVVLFVDYVVPAAAPTFDMSGKGAMKGDYEAIYRELDRLDALLSSVTPLTRQKPSTKSKSKSIADSLDTLLGSLNEIKGHITSQGNLSDAFRAAGTAVDTSKKEIEERQKEVYNSLNRMGRAIEKVCMVASLLASRSHMPHASRNFLNSFPLTTLCLHRRKLRLPLTALLGSIYYGQANSKLPMFSFVYVDLGMILFSIFSPCLSV
jgi:hypothetical protein